MPRSRQVVRIHGAFRDGAGFRGKSPIAAAGVDQRGLAMVDVAMMAMLRRFMRPALNVTGPRGPSLRPVYSQFRREAIGRGREA